jgi:hypothetical protein
MCNDPLLRSFRNLGFNVVRLPSATFAPLLLLESDGRRRVRVVGQLGADLAAAGASLPEIDRDVAVADIAVTASGRVKGDVVLKFLEPFLSPLGVAPSASAALARANDVSVAVTDVRRDAIRPGELARYLEEGTTAHSVHVRRVAERNELYVTTSVLKSSSFSTTVGRDTASELGVGASAPVGTVRIATGRESAGRQVVSFRGSQPLAFAFQAARLRFEDGEYLDYASATGLAGFELPAGASGPSPSQLLLDQDALEPFE